MNHESTVRDLISQVHHLNDHWDCGIVEVIDDPVEVEEFMSEGYPGVESPHSQLCVVRFDYDVDLLEYDHPSRSTPAELLEYILEVSKAINQHMSRGGYKLYLVDDYEERVRYEEGFYHMVFAKARK